VIKKLAGYHQFHAVGRALEATVSASSPEGDRRVGVVWHTQGSGKSLTMAFYAGRVVLHPAMENPTLVVITGACARSGGGQGADPASGVRPVQGVRTAIAKSTAGDRKASGDLDLVIRQIVSKAVSSDEVIDIFAAAGLKNPDISILSDQFLAEVRGMRHKNLAVELLRKLLGDEVKARSRHNLVQSRSFAELLEKSIRRYQNRAIEAAQIIEELIELAKEMREAGRRGEKLNLTSDELAFYDVLEVNDSAVKVLGDDTLKTIARELVETVRRNVTIDWTVKESVRAKLRVIVKRILRKYGYLPRQAGGGDQHRAPASRAALGLLDRGGNRMTAQNREAEARIAKYHEEQPQELGNPVPASDHERARVAASYHGSGRSRVSPYC
jgi:type I site-specific restriction-modification system R (restriction) subunit